MTKEQQQLNEVNRKLDLILDYLFPKNRATKSEKEIVKEWIDKIKMSPIKNKNK